MDLENQKFGVDQYYHYKEAINCIPLLWNRYIDIFMPEIIAMLWYVFYVWNTDSLTSFVAFYPILVCDKFQECVSFL